MSKIEWTEATWNPVVGCSIVSPGCTHCYAMRQARRHDRPGSAYHGTTRASKAGPVWSGKIAAAPWQRLTAPLGWRRPRRVFVNSMGDLFHEDVPDDWIDRVFAVMALSPQHRFQVLTKRSARMREYMTDPGLGMRVGAELMKAARGDVGAETVAIDVAHDLSVKRRSLPNLWLGVSAEDQRRADERIPDLLATPAAVRFASFEPLLGPIELHAATRAGALDWAIVGGESGPRARPMHPDWARGLRDQCGGAGMAFFFKQWGEWVPQNQAPNDLPLGAFRSQTIKQRPMIYSADTAVYRVGKKRAGRLLDGREWNEYPEAAA